MAISCTSGLSVTQTNVDVPGSTTFMIDLVADNASENADIELTIVDSANAMSFSGGGKVERFSQVVTSAGTSVNHQSDFACGSGNKFASVRITMNVFQNGLDCCRPTPSVLLTVTYACPQAATPLHDGAMSFNAAIVERAWPLEKSAALKNGDSPQVA